MKFFYDDIIIELPEYKKIGNVFFKHEKAKQNIKRLKDERGIDRLLEPNYGHSNNMRHVKTQRTLFELNPYFNKYEKCDALHIKRNYLKKHKAGLFIRTADCMAMALIGKYDIYIFHLSVKSLNSGILKILDTIPDIHRYKAVLGPCISAEKYTLEGEEYIHNNTSEFATLGYDKFTYRDQDNRMHLSILDIVKDTLKSKKVTQVFADERCTFENTELGSCRRDRDSRHDNLMLIY